MLQRKTKTEDPNFLGYKDENFPLTYEGLLENKKYFAQQKEAQNPNYKYAGNCTKWFADQIVSKFFKREWKRIKSMSLPSANEFPVKEDLLKNEIKSLVKNDNCWKTRCQLIRYFHKQTFNSSNRNGQYSPNEFWKLIQDDPEQFKKFYHNRLRCSDWFKENSKRSAYFDEDFPDHMHFLADGFLPDFIWSIGVDTSRKAPVISFFKPALAKHLVKEYLSEFSSVYDPFAGLSGRALGTIAAGKKYIGRDINQQILDESQKLLEFAAPVFKDSGVEPAWDLNAADALTTKTKQECVMTCSPYGLSEQWNGQKTADLSCDQWIDKILENVKARRYVFVTDGDITKWKSNVVETLENTSHFGSNFEHVVVI